MRGKKQRRSCVAISISSIHLFLIRVCVEALMQGVIALEGAIITLSFSLSDSLYKVCVCVLLIEALTQGVV